MGTSPNDYEGSCHCGAIGFIYRTEISPEKWNVRACQCSFCRAHAALTTSDPEGSVKFEEHVRGTLHHYRFGQTTADFLICRKCGVYLGAAISAPGGRYGVININALRPGPPNLPPPVAADYEGESAEQRIERRRKRWTPVIGVV
jgi:hypothetical protein